MTAREAPAGSPGSLAALANDDTESCLCLIAGYAKEDGLIARVTAEADRRVMMSPALGDFLELRYVDLGPRPGEAGDRSRPVRRLAADLMAVQETAGRSHFALIVIAKSATDIEGLIGSCAAEPFLAGLRMRFAGIASSDDRERENGFADITSSPEGSWRNEKELVSALLQQCEELPHYFAVRGEPGLTRAELTALRDARVRLPADGQQPEGDVAGTPDQTPLPDVLEDAPGDAGTPALRDTAAAPGHLAGVGGWLGEVPWRRGKHSSKGGDTGAEAAARPARTSMGLVYLLMIVDQYGAADPALGRLQAALLDLDKRIAAHQTCGYQVRAIHGTDGDLRGEMREAGNVSRRAAKRSVKTEDFALVLKGIGSSLRRDRELVTTIARAEGVTAAPPAVVIFTVDPPMADPGAAAVFRALAAEATVVWVVPGKLEDLVSPAFGAECGATVLGEHQAVAEEVLEAMHGGRPAS